MKRTHMVQAKHGITVLLAALFVCLLAGCGAGNGDSRMGMDGYVYVAEAMQNIGWGTAENFYVAGEYLYYLSDSRTVKRIVSEETQYLLDGSKTAEVVCEIIQNKAQLLLQERNVLQ